jgi:hypothetical protein
VAGGAAALAGPKFVGLSRNLTEVLKFPGVASRAGATLGLIIAMLLVAVFAGTPRSESSSRSGWQRGQQRSGQHRYRALFSMHLLSIPGPLPIIAAISLCVEAGGGLYWVTAPVATGFATAWGTLGAACGDQTLVTAESRCP